MPIDDVDDLPVSQEGRTCAIHPMMDDLAPLEPLLEHLRAGGGATERLAFSRGVLLPDGRLDLCKQGVGPHGAAALRAALRHSRHVRDVLLGADHLGVAGASEVAGVIAERPELRTVYMGCNAIGDDGAKALASALRSSTSVRGLWIKRNQVGVEGAKALASMLLENNTLRSIDLVSNPIGLEGVEAIFSSLAQAHAAGRGGVQLLYLCGNSLGVEGAKIVSRYLPHTGLRALYLGGNHLNDEGALVIADALARTPSLEVIGLSSNGIGAVGARAIAHAVSNHPALESLEIGFLKSTDVIGASANTFGDEGARAFAELVSTSKTLTTLDVSGSGVSLDGARALVDALSPESRLVSLSVGVKLPQAVASKLTSVLCRNANRRRANVSDDWRADIARIKSVYRTATSTTSSTGSGDDNAQPPRDAEIRSPSAADIETCARVLKTLREMGASSVKRIELVDLVALSHDVARVTRKTEWGRRAKARAFAAARDLGYVSRTGIRRGRAARIVPPHVELPAPAFAVPERPSVEISETTSTDSTTSPKVLERPRNCYVCKRSYTQLDPFYDQLCPTCAVLNREKREQTADMHGRVVLLTGGRIKIGFRIALKLLRAGARVIVTTRFPFDAARRYESEPDASAWMDRLEIHGIDLRFLSEVERFGQRMVNELPRLDALIHNAAQTIHRPAGFFSQLIEAEEQAAIAGHKLVRGGVLLDVSRDDSAALMLASPGLAMRREVPSEEQRMFPVGSDDGHGQPLDLRNMNSWRLRMGQVSTSELVSVHAVSSLAPFVLTGALRPLLVKTARASTPAHAFVVNVSAVEAQFHRVYKSPFHPHTNMAKAGLNMMARTVAEDLIEDGVLINAVDTGWITNENPFPISEAMAGHGFQPPLDEEDGAARVLDPVFSVLRGGPAITGAFLKDYVAAPW
ncbi:MAG: SDR family NAD(P)-dependent oxidoreductase [Polyangiaceae bacterium]